MRKGNSFGLHRLFERSATICLALTSQEFHGCPSLLLQNRDLVVPFVTIGMIVVVKLADLSDPAFKTYCLRLGFGCGVVLARKI